MSGAARFTVLTPKLIHIQYSTTKAFEDRATFAVVNRRLPVPRFTCTEEGGYLTIQTDSLTLRYEVGSKINRQHKNSTVLGITFQMNGRQILWSRARTALNLHPADGIGSCDDNFAKIRSDMGLDASVTNVPWQLEDSTFYRTFFKNIMRVREKQGIEEIIFTTDKGNLGQNSTSGTSGEGFMYDLSGRRVTNNIHQKGIFITDGKKNLKR